MLLPRAPLSAPAADAPATPQAAASRVLGGVALTSAAVITLLDAPTAGGWLLATALAAGAVAVLPTDRPRGQSAEEPGSVAPDVVLSDDELTERLRALHDERVEEVNMALAEGREDLVRESSDRYTDAALLLLTTARHPGA
jgi:hypothetical protein